MDWSDSDHNVQRDIAILQAQFQDALNDVVEWRDIARSNQELCYLDEMDECLAILRQIAVTRLTSSDPNSEEQDWKTRVGWLLDAYERAKKVRGHSLGYHLSSLICLLIERTYDVQGEVQAREMPCIGENIKRLKKECGWTYDDLANETDIDRKQIVFHAQGRAKPRPRNLKRYSEAFTRKLGRSITPGDLEK